MDGEETDVKELLDICSFDSFANDEDVHGNVNAPGNRFNPFDRIRTYGDQNSDSCHAGDGAPVLAFKDDSDDDQLLNLSDNDTRRDGDVTFENPWNKMDSNTCDGDDDRLLVVIGDGHCRGCSGTDCDGDCLHHGCNTAVQQQDADHCHIQRSSQKSKDNEARNRLIFASILCFLFILAEVIGMSTTTSFVE